MSWNNPWSLGSFDDFRKQHTLNVYAWVAEMYRSLGKTASSRSRRTWIIHKQYPSKLSVAPLSLPNPIHRESNTKRPWRFGGGCRSSEITSSPEIVLPSESAGAL